MDAGSQYTILTKLILQCSPRLCLGEVEVLFYNASAPPYNGAFVRRSTQRGVPYTCMYTAQL